MVDLVAAFGDGAAERLIDVPGFESYSRIERLGGRAAAGLSEKRTNDFADNSGFFVSPSGRCRGVVVGQVFGLDRTLEPAPSNLSRPALIGQRLERLFERHGEGFPLEIDGAFVLIVVIDGSTYVVRDAIGERPLYFLKLAGLTLVADRMGPLMRHPECTRTADPGGILDYLNTGFCPFERTAVSGITKLPAGCMGHIGDDGSVKIKRYHWLARRIGPTDKSEIDASHIRTLLEQAVDRRRIDGAKSALLLSGGVDSSLVGALVGGDQLTGAWSLSFGPDYPNEIAYSALVARHLGVPHNVVTMTARDFRDSFPEAMKTIDEPIGDPLNVPNVTIARHLTGTADVVFNGEGGDPVFGGPKNKPMLLSEIYRASEPQMTLEDQYLCSYNKGAEHLRRMLRTDFLAAAADQPHSRDLLRPWLRNTELNMMLDRLMLTNTRLKGASQILPKVYKAGADARLTVCSPLFDRALAEAAFSASHAQKLHGTREKHILKEAVRDLLPDEIVDRPKSGMLVPVNHWYASELRRWAVDLLLGRQSRIRALLRRDSVAELLRFRSASVRPYFGERIHLLASLEIWMRVHGVGF